MSIMFLKLHKIITVQVYKLLIFWCKGNLFSKIVIILIVMGVFFFPQKVCLKCNQ